MESKHKGILKKKPSCDDKGDHLGIRWDEEVIKEHDKDRGTRMKIDEPKTPYNAGSDNEHESEEEEQAPDTLEIEKHLSEAEENCKKNAEFNAKSLELLNAKLQDVAEPLKDEEDVIDEEERKKRAEFKKKMKNHYKGEANAALLLKKKYS